MTNIHIQYKYKLLILLLDNHLTHLKKIQIVKNQQSDIKRSIFLSNLLNQ